MAGDHEQGEEEEEGEDTGLTDVKLKMPSKFVVDRKFQCQGVQYLVLSLQYQPHS